MWLKMKPMSNKLEMLFNSLTKGTQCLGCYADSVIEHKSRQRVDGLMLIKVESKHQTFYEGQKVASTRNSWIYLARTNLRVIT